MLQIGLITLDQKVVGMATGRTTSDCKMEAAPELFEELGLGKSKQERLRMGHCAVEWFNIKEKDKRNEQKKEDESFRKCPTCAGKRKYRCTGCYLELY